MRRIRSHSTGPGAQPDLRVHALSLVRLVRQAGNDRGDRLAGGGLPSDLL